MKLKRHEEKTIAMLKTFSPELVERYDELGEEGRGALLDDLTEAGVFDSLYMYKKAEAGSADLSAIAGNDIMESHPFMVRLEALRHLVGWTLMDILHDCGEPDVITEFAINRAGVYFQGYIDKVLSSVQKAKARYAVKND